MYKHSLVFLYIVVGLGLLGITGGSALGYDHLIAISHNPNVQKLVTVYRPDGQQLFRVVPEPENEPRENYPTFIESIPSAAKIFISCTVDHEHRRDHHHHHDHEEGYVMVLDYQHGAYGIITEVSHVETGKRPFHAYVSPDKRFVVSNDEDGTITFIEPESLATETIAGGSDHTVITFVGDENGFDMYATHWTTGEPSKVDIIDVTSGTIRATVEGLLPRPHAITYSPVSQKVYIGCQGGVEVFGTAGAERDQHLETIGTSPGMMTPNFYTSPDGLTVYGNAHLHATAGSYLYAIDVLTGATTTCPSVSCKDFALSPDGKYLLAGDYMKPPEQSDGYHVQVIDADSNSGDFMAEVHRFVLGPTPELQSRTNFMGTGFSPDSSTAYIGLIDRDEIMAIDISTMTASFFPVEMEPLFIHVIPLETGLPSAVDNRIWVSYE